MNINYVLNTKVDSALNLKKKKMQEIFIYLITFFIIINNYVRRFNNLIKNTKRIDDTSRCFKFPNIYFIFDLRLILDIGKQSNRIIVSF